MCSPSEVSHSVNMPVTQTPVSSSSSPIPHDRQVAADDRGLARRTDQHQRADPQGVRRPPGQQQHVTEDVADAEQRGDHRPRPRAVVVLGHQHRPDHEDRRQHHRVVDAEAAEVAEHPRAATAPRCQPSRSEVPNDVGAGRRPRPHRLDHAAGRSGTSSTTDTAKSPRRRATRSRSPGERDQDARRPPGRRRWPARRSGRAGRWRVAGCPGSTVVGSSPLNAGEKNASAAPNTAASTTRCGTWRVPVSSRTAAIVWRDQAYGVGGDQDPLAVPAVGPHARRHGQHHERQELRREVTATSPTPPPIDSTANGSATLATRSPRTDSTWLPKSSRYCGSSRSTAGTSDAHEASASRTDAGSRSPGTRAVDQPARLTRRRSAWAPSM